MHNYLLVEIEKCRNKMIDLTTSYDLTSDIVVNTSKNLDILLNNLDQLQGNNRDSINK